ncbi:glycosyltransferase [Thermosynechococcus sichuanensis E542]|uniref:glycosyltransferase n=1 Tax=Thermosynechococcus sichuanensis TaxID=3161974 RepID=UPI0015E58CF7|nr:glycosyltransferase [Thermosynechococcus vestitus]AXY67614.2 glycosyltransferase [Thermosynechococcus vestitus E542]
MSPTLSVITATYNAENYLPSLIESLYSQTDQDFEWVVADGGSKDKTIELIKQAQQKLKRVVIQSQSDFGIYDALNRAVKLATGEYYLVLGADDILFPDAIANYKAACARTNADFVTTLYYEGSKRLASLHQPAWEWFSGMHAHITGHTVGTVIRRSLHQTFGEYSRHFPIAADQLFVLKAIHGGATVSLENFIAGRTNPESTTGQNPLGCLLELYRVKVMVGHSLLLQTLVLFYQIVIWWPQIRKARA